MSLNAAAFEQTERLLALRGVSVLRGLRAEQLAAIAEYTEERYFRPGDHLIRAGQPVDAMQLVLEGRVRLERAGRVMGHVGLRYGAGALSMLTRRRASWDAVASDDTLTLELRREPLLELMADDFSLFMRIMGELAAGVIDTRRGMGPRAGYLAEPAGDDPERPQRPLDLVERLFILRQSMGFAGARLNAMVALARHIEEDWRDRGTALWREGEPYGSTYFIRAGTVRGERDDTGQRFWFNAGTFVGGLDNMAGQPRWFTAVAETGLHVMRIDFEEFYDVLEDRFDLAERFLAMIAGEMLDLAERRTTAAAAAGSLELGPLDTPPL